MRKVNGKGERQAGRRRRERKRERKRLGQEEWSALRWGGRPH